METKFIYFALFILIIIFVIWKDDKKKKKDEFELKIIHDSYINIFNIEKKQLCKLSNIFYVNKFKDFVMLSDFNNNIHNFSYDTEHSTIRNSYSIIDRDLLFRITSYKGALQKVEERIKIEYMCWHTGKSIKYNEIEYEKFDIKNINDEIENNRRDGSKYKK
jgi:hypothetical protein